MLTLGKNSSDSLEQEIVFSIKSGRGGNLGVITLNRPQVLNALNLPMLQVLDAQLDKWAKDNSIKAVVIRGEGERGFCAGGDLRSIYYSLTQPADHLEPSIFHVEYSINQKIFHFPKPYIALIHGITMGGGAGLSVYASHRVAAPDLMFAMPESKIGFYPDVGAAYFLQQRSRQIGLYLGLTGNTVNVSDALQLGLVDSVVPYEKFNLLIETIAACEFGKDANAAIAAVIKTLRIDVIELSASDLKPYQAIIERCFAHPTIEEVLSALQAEENTWCKQILSHLHSLSPTSLKIILAHFHEQAHLGFDACMQMNYLLSTFFLQNHDFREGIRAAIIDKDKRPRWHPNNLSQVEDGLLGRIKVLLASFKYN